MNETDQLKEASEGLLWMSESEYPFEVFTWDKWDKADSLTPTLVLKHAEYPPDTPVDVVGVDEFFAPATTEEDWHNEDEKAQVKRYQNLVTTLKQNLKDIQVYKIGEVEIDIYSVGKTPAGLWQVFQPRQ
jgi:hypothetical protein